MLLSLMMREQLVVGIQTMQLKVYAAKQDARQQAGIDLDVEMALELGAGPLPAGEAPALPPPQLGWRKRQLKWS